MSRAWIDIQLPFDVTAAMRKAYPEPLSKEASPEAAAAWTKAQAAAEADAKARTFVGRGLARPGVQIEVRSRAGAATRYLFGNINCAGGACDCCAELHSETVVLRYRVLLDDKALASG